MAQVVADELSAIEVRPDEGVVRLGDDLPPILPARSLKVDCDDSLQVGLEVGEEIEGLRDIGHEHRLRGEVGDERLPPGSGILEVENVQLLLGERSPADRDHHEAAVVGDGGVRYPFGLLGSREYERVVCLAAAKRMEEDPQKSALVGVLGAFRRAVHGAVVEARPVLAPRDGRELRPLDHVIEVDRGRDVADAPGVPVRSGRARGVGELGPVLGDREHGHRDGAVSGKPVRVEQDPTLGHRLLHHPQDGLALKPRVAALEPAPTSFEGNAEPRVVPQLDEARADLLPCGHLCQERLCQLVLRFDPGGGLGSVAVLQPAVRISDGLAVVVVHLGASAGRRIGTIEHRNLPGSGAMRQLRRRAQLR